MAEDVAAQLRHKHVRTLEVLQTVMDENERLKKIVKDLEANRGAIDQEQRTQIEAKVRAESKARISELILEGEAKDRTMLDLQHQLERSRLQASDAEAKAKEAISTRADSDEVDALRRELSTLRADVEMQQHEQRKQSEAAALAAAKAETSLRDQLETQARELRDARSALEDAKSSDAQRDVLKQGLKAAEQRADEAEVLAKRWEAEAERRKRDDAQRSDRLAVLEDQLRAATGREEALKKSVGQLKARAAATAVQVDELQQRLLEAGDAKGMLEMLQRAKKVLENELGAEQERVAGLEASIAGRDEVNEQLQAQILALEQELQRVRSLASGSNFGKFVAVKHENERLKESHHRLSRQVGKLSRQVSRRRSATGQQHQQTMQPQQHQQQPVSLTSSQSAPRFG